MMKNPQIIQEIIKAHSYQNIIDLKDSNLNPHLLQQYICQYFPQVGLLKESFQDLLHDELFFRKIQKMFDIHQELIQRNQELQHKNMSPSRQNQQESIETISKKTRAALARRQEKNQQEMRKDQIFVRLTPKSQNCIQFMLCNRNFPRMEVKLSCNQHLDYLINYLTNKWIRGKVGVKVVLYPDSSFLKSTAISQKQKVLKEPLNNYHMFTDIMTCCGVQQNGVLNMTYQIVEAKKGATNGKLLTTQKTKELRNSYQNQSLRFSSVGSFHKNKQNQDPFQEKTVKLEERQQSLPKAYSPDKNSLKDPYMPEASLFGKNLFGDESMFGSLGFNYQIFAQKKQDPLFSLNSNPYFPRSKETIPNFHDQLLANSLMHLSEKQEKSQQNGVKKEVDLISQDRKQNSREKENAASNREEPRQGLDNLMSVLDQIEKEKEGPESNPQLGQLPAEDANNNSNRLKDVKDIKIVSIVKKKNNTNS